MVDVKVIEPKHGIFSLIHIDLDQMPIVINLCFCNILLI